MKTLIKSKIALFLVLAGLLTVSCKKNDTVPAETTYDSTETTVDSINASVDTTTVAPDTTAVRKDTATTTPK